MTLRDLNADGDASDPGEAALFVGETGTARTAGLTDLALVPGGGFLGLVNSTDGIVRILDQNGDGDALDEGEVELWLLDGGATFSTPQAILIVPESGEPPPPPVFLRGDSTADGKVDISDPVAILGYLFLGSRPGPCLDAFDTDDSGVLNLSDAIYALNYLFSGGAPPPLPFPGAGTDPTGNDDLSC